jgi:hypothetical protein
VVADSVTELADAAGKVLVAGSHGGLVAAWYAARSGARAVILNDAGVGKDEAGVAGLAWLEAIGMAAAAVAGGSGRIGDGADMLARGRISRANEPARSLGVTLGMKCSEAAGLLRQGSLQRGPIPAYAEGRYELAPGVCGLDSVGMVEPTDAGRVLVIGSHASLHGGRPQSALAVDAALAVFNDAGGDCSRLPVLQARGIAALAVDCMSARIGDARSMWNTGCVSLVNGAAAALGASRGMTLQSAVNTCIAAQKSG